MSSGFVTESEALEARKKRQEEWEKVRQPDQPLGMDNFFPHFYDRKKIERKHKLTIDFSFGFD